MIPKRLLQPAFAASVLCAAATAAPAIEIPVPDVRILAGAPDGEAGRWRAGIEVDLPDGWHTYWRSPGDSGIPPSITVEEAGNLAAVELLFPAPLRHFDGYGTSIVYQDHVVLPLRIAATDPSAPIHARIRFDYGYCREICVPASIVLPLDIDPAVPAPPADAALLDRAASTIPRPEGEAGETAPQVLALRRIDPETVEIRVDPRGERDVDLFAEGPVGWYISPPERHAEGDLLVFRLSLDGRPKGAETAGVDLRLTLTGRRPVDVLRPLP